VTKPDDQRLARRAAQGDRRAFEEIYRHYHQSLYRFCMALVADPQDAQEALQNTMVKVLRSLPGERRKIELRPWIYRIARNEAIETLRKRRDGVELTAERAGASRETAETVADRERLRALLADLGELPGRQRDALVMRELAGLGFAEIAASLETSAAAARQTVYEARLNLHRMEEGREMRCDAVMRALSDGDARVARRRELRTHLRSCASCRAFRGAIEDRRSTLAAVAPLPAVAAAGVLHGALGASAHGAVAAGAAAGTGGVTGPAGAGAGKVLATSAIVKAAAGVGIVAAIGVSAADREGLIEIGAGSGGANPSAQRLHASPGSTRHGSHPVATRAGSDPAGGRGGGVAPNRAAGGVAPSRAAAGLAAAGTDSAGPQAGSGGREAGGGPARRKAHARSGPGRLPEASAHGQATAGGHKAAHGNPSPGAGSRSESSPAPAHSSTPPPQPPAEASQPAPEPGSPPAATSPPPPPDRAAGHSSSPPSGSF
jgi:RNA polymerase sigma factor (sigma-70 family)